MPGYPQSQAEKIGATELSFLEHLPASERSTYSYYLMFIKELKGREYVYTYPRPLLRDEEVEQCAIRAATLAVQE